MNYKFPQFNVTINNPTITIDLNSIGDKAIEKQLSVNIVLVTETASFGVRTEDMPYLNTWEDNQIEVFVNDWLVQFEI